MGLVAKGNAKAAEILAGQFTLVATNVPFLGRGNQDLVLKEYCNTMHPDAKADLATCFTERCLNFCSGNGTAAIVSTQYWLFLTTYKKLRKKLLEGVCWDIVARLGSGAFETIGGEVVNVALLVYTQTPPQQSHEFAGVDLSSQVLPREKADALSIKVLSRHRQKAQLKNPNIKITLEALTDAPPLEQVAIISEGLHTGDVS